MSLEESFKPSTGVERQMTGGLQQLMSQVNASPLQESAVITGRRIRNSPPHEGMSVHLPRMLLDHRDAQIMHWSTTRLLEITPWVPKQRDRRIGDRFL